MFILSSIDGQLGCFHLLASVSSVAMNIGIQVLVRVPAFSSFRYKTGSGIAGLNASAMFKYLRNCKAVYHNGCTILHSHQQCTKVPIPLHSHQHLFLFNFGFNYT